jgi:hypothetical protein
MEEESSITHKKLVESHVREGFLDRSLKEILKILTHMFYLGHTLFICIDIQFCIV